MNIRKILSRREEIRTELRNILDTAPDGALTAEAEARAAQLEAEAETLNTAERRAGLLSELDQKADAKPIETRGNDDGVSVFGLKPEQRMAQFVERTTGEPTANLSAGRAIVGMLTGRWADAEAERRAMSTTTGTAGGFLIPDSVSSNVIDLARNQSVVIRAGALTIPMQNQNMRVVQVVTDPSASWRAEGAAISESEGTFSALNLTAYSLAALVRVNNELLDDAAMFAATLDQQLSAGLALELDRVALYGNGVGKPLGLRDTVGVNEVSMGANGLAQPDYDDVLDLIQEVEEANGSPTVAIMSPRTKTKLSKLVTGITSDLTKLVPPAEYTALRRLVSNQVSVTETQGNSSVASTMFIGGFENMAFAIRQNITIEATRVADDAFAKNQTLIRAIMRADVATFRPSHFGRLIGIL
jgi:HK97 family phage major capsid protein